ncbi:MAG: NAD-dependent epimerase/dehydratase family protein, partial [Desulfobacterales bacterium]
MKILVTGGAGFIGSHIVDACIEAGHRVVVLDDLSTGNREFLNPNATFYEMGIQDPSIKDIFAKEEIEVINHHAAQSSVNVSVNDPVFDASVNIIGSLHLLQNAVSFGVRKFLFASTGGAIYGDQEPIPASEQHPCEPVSPYGIAKFCLEKYFLFYQKEYNLSALTLRYSNVFGPRQNPHGEAGVVAIFCNRLENNESPVIYGDGEQTRDFISVHDVVRANLIGLENFHAGIYNIGTG